jgi:hypothetical protein
MSLSKEQQESNKKTTIPHHVVVRKTRSNPVKVMLRWVYWLVLIGVICFVVVTSFDAGMAMYKGLG